MTESKLKESIRYYLRILRREEEQPLDWRALRNALDRYGVYDIYDDVIDLHSLLGGEEAMGAHAKKGRHRGVREDSVCAL